MDDPIWTLGDLRVAVEQLEALPSDMPVMVAYEGRGGGHIESVGVEHVPGGTSDPTGTQMVVVRAP